MTMMNQLDAAGKITLLIQNGRTRIDTQSFSLFKQEHYLNWDR